ncbi:MAG: peptidyl-prolyl cis-trans isomerase [Tahibacter sp.]
MRHCLPLIALAALTACSSGDNSRSSGVLQFNAGTPALRVNDLPIPESMLKYVAEGRNLDLSNKEQRVDAIRELSDYVLLAQAAQREGIEKNPEFAAVVEATRLQGVANAMLAHYTKTHPVTDEMVRKDYDEQVKKAGPNTYDFSQLLFDNEADALKATDALISGTNFAKVFDEWRTKAKIGKAFKAVRASQLPTPELVEALTALKAGESTKVPVKSKFGWHLLHVDAVQPYAPPAFDTIKNELRKIAEQRQRAAYTERLRGEALILDLQTPSGKPEKAAEATPAPAPPKQG